MFFRLKGSNTDPFRIGTIIGFGATNPWGCPVHSMLAYLRTLPCDNLPLFTLYDDRLLTRRLVTQLLRDALPNINDIGTHSFHIGGASAALSAGAWDAMIEILGRWSSDCYIRYWEPSIKV